jgi:hypothetical protein
MVGMKAFGVSHFLPTAVFSSMLLWPILISQKPFLLDWREYREVEMCAGEMVHGVSFCDPNTKDLFLSSETKC